jgi:hypothetical protein
MDKEIADFLIGLVDDVARETRKEIVDMLEDNSSMRCEREYAERLVNDIEKCARTVVIIKNLVKED